MSEFIGIGQTYGQTSRGGYSLGCFNSKCKNEIMKKEKAPVRGIEPRPRRWERRILATRPHGIDAGQVNLKDFLYLKQIPHSFQNNQDHILYKIKNVSKERQ